MAFKVISCIGSIWAVNLHWLDNILLYNHQNIAFLVPDSCWTTERNGNSISADVTYEAFEKILKQRLLQLQTIWQLFWTFWYCRKNTIYNTLAAKPAPKTRFSNLFINLLQIIYKFSKNVPILYIYHLIQNVNLNGLMWFFCKINTILMQCLNKSLCVRCKTGERLSEARLYPSF